MAGDACIQEAEWKDLSFLGNGTAGESCRHGVAVLESHGLYARGAARHSRAATKFQVRIPGRKLSEKEVEWRPFARTLTTHGFQANIPAGLLRRLGAALR